MLIIKSYNFTEAKKKKITKPSAVGQMRKDSFSICSFEVENKRRCSQSTVE